MSAKEQVLSAEVEERAALSRLIGQVSRQWRRAADEKLRPHGLTQATWLPLLYIARSPEPPRQKDLAEQLSVEGSTVVRLLDMLESDGLIRRQEGSGDRRAKMAILTDAGRAIVQRVEAVGHELRTEMLAGIPERDIATVLRVLTKLSARLEQAAGGGGGA
jgi:MarR family transcriptional regulator for hemolysin